MIDIDIRQVLLTLAKERSLFHSEADFQHAFAWKIHQGFPEAEIRLEYPPQNSRIHLDVWVRNGPSILAVELKYKTRVHSTKIGEENYRLLNHGAQDLGRYDFLQDIQRLERYLDHQANAVGYAILLTNDHLYWKSTSRSTVDADFRLDDGRSSILGELKWGERASKGTKRGREDPITLRKTYPISWEDYPGDAKFRYLLVEVR